MHTLFLLPTSKFHFVQDQVEKSIITIRLWKNSMHKIPSKSRKPVYESFFHKKMNNRFHRCCLLLFLFSLLHTHTFILSHAITHPSFIVRGNETRAILSFNLKSIQKTLWNLKTTISFHLITEKMRKNLTQIFQNFNLLTIMTYKAYSTTLGTISLTLKRRSSSIKPHTADKFYSVKVVRGRGIPFQPLTLVLKTVRPTRVIF